MRRNTPKRAKQEREYLTRSREWLTGKACAVCTEEAMLTDFAFPGLQPVYPAAQCHHMRGRIGALLLDERFWLPVCAAHHQKITVEPAWAIAHGWSLSRVGAA